MSYQPILGPVVRVPDGGGEGGGQTLPKWAYIAGGGDPLSKQFSTDLPSRAATGQVNINRYTTSDEDWYTLFLGIGTSMILIFSGEDGGQYIFSVTGIIQNGSDVLKLNVSNISSSTGNWSGVYSLDIFTSLQGVSDPSNPQDVATKNYVDTLPQLTTLAEKQALDSAPTPLSADNPVASMDDVTAAIAAFSSNPGTLAAIIAAAGITPAPDGTVTPVTSITTATGVPTDIS